MTTSPRAPHDLSPDAAEVSCQDAADLLNGYVDQALGEADAAACERHLFRCAACRDRYRRLKALRADLACDPTPQPLPLRLELSLTAAAERFISGQPTTSHPYLPSLSAPEPTPTPLPAHLDLALEALAARFVAQQPLDLSPTAPPALAPAANADAETDAEAEAESSASEWQQVVQWLRQRRAQIALAASVLIATLGGMGVLAYRHGNVPALTHREYQVSALPAYGNALLHAHRAYAAEHQGEPAYNADTLAFLFSRHLPYAVPLRATPFGAATDGRILPLDDTPTPIVRFDHPSGPISQVVIPTARALDALGDLSGADADAPRAQCVVPQGVRCFDDSLGASLCIQYSGGALTTVWIASMPSARLEAAISAPNPN